MDCKGNAFEKRWKWTITIRVTWLKVKESAKSLHTAILFCLILEV